MVDFKLSRRGVVLEYTPTIRDSAWVWEGFSKGEVKVSQAFTFRKDDLIEEPNEAELRDIGSFTYRFRFARAGRTYYRIDGRKLGIANDVRIAVNGVNWRRRLFVAERNISIFGRLAKLISADQKIFVGGDRPDAIPIEIFEDLIRRFPNTYEMDRYGEARVANIVGEYLQPQRDFRAQYETYLSKRKSARGNAPLRADELLETEIEKFDLVRNTLHAWLKTGDKSEDEWQKQLIAILLLIFPKYIAVLEKVPVEDRYTTPHTTIKRQIDLALVDVNGNIDVIEIKKPVHDVMLRRTRYRDNYVPTGDLSGTIMQAEKYLFYLSKGGVATEEKLTSRYESLLPPGLRIRITNPKALLILGRDRKGDGTDAFSAGQTSDLEIIKRKYANMIDIMTYDDLLRRLDNIIASLKRRRADGLNAGLDG